MFSGRTPKIHATNRMSRALAGRAVPPLDLTVSNPTAVGLDVPGDPLAPLADPRGRFYAPEPAGILAARQAVAEYYGRRAVAADPSRIVLAASSSEAYGWLFRLLCDPGDDRPRPRPELPAPRRPRRPGERPRRALPARPRRGVDLSRRERRARGRAARPVRGAGSEPSFSSPRTTRPAPGSRVASFSPSWLRRSATDSPSSPTRSSSTTASLRERTTFPSPRSARPTAVLSSFRSEAYRNRRPSRR